MIRVENRDLNNKQLIFCRLIKHKRSLIRIETWSARHWAVRFYSNSTFSKRLAVRNNCSKIFFLLRRNFRLHSVNHIFFPQNQKKWGGSQFMQVNKEREAPNKTKKLLTLIHAIAEECSRNKRKQRWQCF